MNSVICKFIYKIFKILNTTQTPQTKGSAEMSRSKLKKYGVLLILCWNILPVFLENVVWILPAATRPQLGRPETSQGFC